MLGSNVRIIHFLVPLTILVKSFGSCAGQHTLISCAPSSIEFQIDLSLTCANTTITASETILQESCEIIASNNNTSDLTPVAITQVQIDEFRADTNGTETILAQRQFLIRFIDGDSFTYYSFDPPTDGMRSIGFEMVMTGENALGQTIKNFLSVRYTNANVAPVFEVGALFGWVVLSNFSPPDLTECPDSAPSVSPSSSPTNPPDFVGSEGNRFMFSFLQNAIEGRIPSVELHITANDNSTSIEYSVEYPVGTLLMKGTVIPGSSSVVTLPANASTGWEVGEFQANAVLVQTDDPSKHINVYLANRQSGTSDAAVALSIDALGTSYMILDYSGTRDADFVVTAVEDNTEVTVRPSAQLVDHGRSQFTFTLDRGQSYYGKALGLGRSITLTGTRIDSSKPVQVTNGNFCQNVPSSVRYCDHIFEVAVPLSSWSTLYLAGELPLRNASVYRIVAAEDTNVTIHDENDSLVGNATIAAGEFYDTGLLSGSIYIRSVTPIAVAQYMTGGQSVGASSGDPSMVNIVPPEQYLKKYTFSTIDFGVESHYVVIICQEEDVGVLTLDGVPVSLLSQIGDTGYYSRAVFLADGVHTTESFVGGHGIVIAAYATDTSYLHPGGLQYLRPSLFDQAPLVPSSGPVVESPTPTLTTSPSGLIPSMMPVETSMPTPNVVSSPTGVAPTVSPDVPSSVSGRFVDSNGDRFVLSFLRNYESRDTGVLVELQVTTNGNSTVGFSVEYPMGVSYTSAEVSPGQATVVSLPKTATYFWGPGVSPQRNSVYVYTNEPNDDGEISVVMINRSPFTSDAALALPVDALNTHYVIMSYTNIFSYSANEFVVTAIYDNTTVTVTPSTVLVGRDDDQPFTFTLFEGESYYASGELKDNVTGSVITGTIIEATLPVTVTNGVVCANVLPSDRFCDHIFEVAPPVESWDTFYVAGEIPRRDGGAVYRFVSSGATEVQVYQGNGEYQGNFSLEYGDYFESTEMSGDFTFFSQDASFLVAQYMTGLEADQAVGGDPSMVNLVPQANYLKKYTFSTVAGFDDHLITIICTDEDVGLMTLDGDPIDGSAFTGIVLSGYSKAVLLISEGTYVSESFKGGHMVYVQGYEFGTSYMYAGGMGYTSIASSQQAQDIGPVSTSKVGVGQKLGAFYNST